MNRVGKVIKENGNFVVVEMNSTSACSGCNHCGNDDDSPDKSIRAFNDIGAKKGDIVEINMETQNVLLAATIAYGIPFIAFLTGVLLADKMFNSELISALSGFIFMAISYLMINRNEEKFYSSKKYVPEVVKIHQKYQDVCFNIK
ncbi:SoxR reducing system RseC family protein [Clostridiaceae bacterium HSG29]|nr:SoxR reducing system RseC family protein [Clostridiaceae bacterium HSG29]